ncbi:hypothetical protein C7293_22740 [filamentous cyanobacterium CCT1]|nr:hypothetical protein C7293_22740 [filamentous cyanobacterium CCT1]PSN78705.1 hypothetical protein C8B47_15545 [filamentous cyanobacterium CCP4]
MIGINDYFSVGGYKHLKSILQEAEGTPSADQAYIEAINIVKTKKLLPVVECRMNNILQNRHGKSGVRINFHIIFSDEVDIDNVETFIKSLKINDEMIGSKYLDSKFLLNDVSVNFNEILGQLKSETFKNKHLIWLPYDEYGGIDEIDPTSDKLLKAELIKSADLMGSSNENQINFFLGKHEKYSEEQIKDWIGKLKPCIKGSDSHNVKEELGRLKDEKSRPTDKFFWAKADPTFEGLCQIVHEPEDRIHIGKRPPKLDIVDSNKTFYISRVRIKKKESSSLKDKWFDCELDLNHGLVAIIGNKGKGKSALTDIIALVGNTRKKDHFSFLTKDRFRIKNGRLAANFEASLLWEDGVEFGPIGLDENPSPDSIESTIYIPQSYLEEVCTENNDSEKSLFQQEIQQVIFSHLDEAQKLEQNSMDELIAYKTDEQKKQAKLLKIQLDELNQKIVSLEQKLKPGYLKKLREELANKMRQLEGHVSNKPHEPLNPKDLPEDAQAQFASIRDQLSTKNTALSSVEKEISEAREKRTKIYKNSAEIENFKVKISSFEGEFQSFMRDSADILVNVDLDIHEIVKLYIDRKPIEEFEKKNSQERESLELSLSNENEQSLVFRKNSLSSEIKALESKLNEPQRQYQEYLRAVGTWEREKNEIEGSSEKPNTIKFYEHEIKCVEDELESKIEELESGREEVARNIYRCTSEICKTYKQLFSGLQDLIDKSTLIKNDFRLSFGASVVESSLKHDFFENYISQGVTGSFCGKADGEKKLGSLISKYDFDNEDEVIQLVKDLIEHLKVDKRDDLGAKLSIEGQIKKAKSLQELYNYLWSFDYLKPEYYLKLDGKHLTQLSPGERGSLLLVFYLLIDQSRKPIIIDQPEGNLDNFTVYNLLFPVIKEVKRQRQIIMVTHSPNIAVVCDAEQVIHAEFDRLDGNKITYTSGSIEDPVINKHIVDVLEGTRPAFRKRDSKYQS